MRRQVRPVATGSPLEALRSLTVQAIASLRAGCPIRTRAWITGVHAEALAAADDGWEARRALRRAERDLERADSRPDGEWTGNYRRESFDHQTLTQVVDDVVGVVSARVRHELRRLPPELLPAALLPSRLHERSG
jgi:hypothetical protein